MNYKLWKRQRRVPNKIRLRAGDPIIVIAGKDKGTKGKISSINRDRGTLIIDGVNEVHDFRRGGGPQNPGEIRRVSAPIHVSNVMFWSDKLSRPVRIGVRFDKGKRIRCSHKHKIDLDK